MFQTDKADLLCVNTIRSLAIDMVQKANSGHPGLPLGAAPMAYVLWQRHLRVDGDKKDWRGRDRFVLSAGHGSALIYSLLHLYGFDVEMDDLKNFRQWESKTPGHPESFMTPGVECTTGPLGQGVANAVGMAMAERHLVNRFGDAWEHRTYCIAGDGCLMEGIAYEAASLAGHIGLSRLTLLYDSNDISLDGPLSLSFSEDVQKRFESCGWHVQTVVDGDHDLAGIDDALLAANAETERPSLIIVRTTIGFGSPAKAGSSEAHGSPLGPAEVANTKAALGLDPAQSFFVPSDAAARFAQGAARGAAARQAWEARIADLNASNPDLARAIDEAFDQDLPADLALSDPAYETGAAVPTRKAGGAAVNALAARIPWLLGGDADLSCSTNTAVGGAGAFSGRTGEGRNIHYGVREHAMGAIANGFAYHGGVRPYTATFFVFSDYMRPPIRLAALSKLPVIFVFTHDSVFLGEDGPTHQPVEQLMSLRAMPGLDVIRPADARETNAAWRAALAKKDGPSVIVLSRQALPVLAGTESGPPVERGAYVVSEANGAPSAILIASGSEVSLAIAAQKSLQDDGVAVRVVSMPCMSRFNAQDEAYRESVLPRGVRARVSVEAGVTHGWERYVGDAGQCIGIDRFGASAPDKVIMEHLGFTVPAVVAAVQRSVAAAG